MDANQNLEGKEVRNKKKTNKILAWCGQCCGRGKRKVKKKVKKIKKKRKEKKAKEKRGDEKLVKKSIIARLKDSRCWGRGKKKDTVERRKGDEEGKRDEREELYEGKAGTSRDSRRRVTIDKSDSRISFEEKRETIEERKPRKSKERDSSRPEKTVSYAEFQRVYKTSGKGIDPLRDIAKSCCYLCTENSLAIAEAMRVHPVLSDKSVNVNINDTLESSCSPMNVHVRTVKSLLKIKVRDTCTSSVGFPEERKIAKPKKKKKKFRFFPKIRRTECPVRQHVGCVTESTIKKCKPCAKPKPKPKPNPKEKEKLEPCCRDRPA